MLKNKVLRTICEPKRVEITGEWRSLHNAELHALYSSPNIIRNLDSRGLRWEGHVGCREEPRKAFKVLKAGKWPSGILRLV